MTCTYHEDNKQNMLRVYLKYDYKDNPVIHGIKRISTPIVTTF